MILKQYTLIFLLLITSSYFGTAYVIVNSISDLKLAVKNQNVLFHKHKSFTDDILLSAPYVMETNNQPNSYSTQYYLIFSVDDSFVYTTEEQAAYDSVVNALQSNEITPVLITSDQSLFIVVGSLVRLLSGKAILSNYKENEDVVRFVDHPNNTRGKFVGLLVFDPNFDLGNTRIKPKPIPQPVDTKPDDSVMDDVQLETDAGDLDVDEAIDSDDLEDIDDDDENSLKNRFDAELNKLRGAMVKIIDISMYNNIVDELNFNIKKFDSDITAAYVIMSNKYYDVDKLYNDNGDDNDDNESVGQLKHDDDAEAESLDLMHWNSVASKLTDTFRLSGLNVEYIPLTDNNPSFNIKDQNKKDYIISKDDLSKFEDEVGLNYDLRIAGHAANRTITLVADNELVKKYPNIKFGSLTYHKLVGGWFKFHGIFVLTGSNESFKVSKITGERLQFMQPPSDLDVEKLLVTAFSNDYRGIWRDINNTVDPIYRFPVDKFVAEVVDIVVGDVAPEVAHSVFNIAIALINSISVDKKVNKFTMVEDLVKNSLKTYNDFDLLNKPIEPTALDDEIKQQSHIAAMTKLFMAYKKLYKEYSENLNRIEKLESAPAPVPAPEPVPEPESVPEQQVQVEENSEKEQKTEHLKTEPASKGDSKTNVTEIVLYVVCSILIAGIAIYASSKCLCKQRVRFIDFYKAEEANAGN